MGYRKLLKDYMHHVADVLGSDLVELAVLTHALGKRDVGELRAIAAELKRESFDAAAPRSYDYVVRALLAQGRLDIEQLDAIIGVDHPLPDEALDEEEFREMLLNVAALVRNEHR